MSADVLLKKIIILNELRIAQLCSQNKQTLVLLFINQSLISYQKKKQSLEA